MSDEKNTKNKFCKILKDLDFFYYCTNDRGRAGVPDVYVCGKNGRSIWFELKKLRSGTKLKHPLTIQQSLFLRDINNSSGLGIMLVELPDGGWHYERINQVGEVEELEWKDMNLVALLESV